MPEISGELSKAIGCAIKPFQSPHIIVMNFGIEDFFDTGYFLTSLIEICGARG